MFNKVASQIDSQGMPDYTPDDSQDDEYIPWDCDRDYPLENDGDE